MNSIEQIEYRGFNINIHHDDQMESPREDDNMGKMICFHSRHNLGDEHNFDRDSWQELLAMEVCPNLENTIEFWDTYGHHTLKEDQVDEKIQSIIEKILDRHYIILPLYLYDHSGITMNTTGFSCQWDSGQVGVIYISREDAKKEYPSNEYPILNDKEYEAKAIKYLKGEVQTYDDFLTGSVYGYTIEPKDTNKNIECDDSCWGFYPEHHEAKGYHGIEDELKYMIDEAKSAIDYAIKEYRESVKQEKVERVKMSLFISECWAY